jgi:ferredoxin-type protein NapH
MTSKGSPLNIVSAEDHPDVGRWRRLRLWTWSHRLTAAAFLTLIVLGRYGWVNWFQGSPTAAQWFHSVPLVDPLAGLEVVLASGRSGATLLFGLSICTLVGLVLGRVFCGWICPLGLLLELYDPFREWLRGRLQRAGLRLPEISLSTSLKYWVLLMCLGLSLFASLPVFTMFSPINLATLGLGAVPLLGLAVVLPLLVFEYFVPRGYCRALCPLGALYSLLGRWALLRVWIVGDEQLECQQCTLRCPMGIRVMEDHVQRPELIPERPNSIDDPECSRCGTCTDVCLGRILRLGFRPRSAMPAKRLRPRPGG